MEKVKTGYDKELRQIARTKEALKLNYEEVKESQILNRLYKQYKKLADAMASSIKPEENSQGRDVTGLKEYNDFINMVSMDKFTYKEFSNLSNYMLRLVSKT